MKSPRIFPYFVLNYEQERLVRPQPALQRVPGTAADLKLRQGCHRVRPCGGDTSQLPLRVMLTALVTACLLLLITGAAGAEDVASGKALHQQACTGCHGTEVYTRPDRKIDSLAGLERQVQRCANNAAKVDWTASQMDAVVNYLNDTFYGFD